MGNKTSVLHILYALFPLNYERYIEPFGGSGAVLLGKKKPDKFEVYNDYNHNLVNLFRCMRDRPMAFIKELDFIRLIQGMISMQSGIFSGRRSLTISTLMKNWN